MKTEIILALAVLALTMGCATISTARKNLCINNLNTLDGVTLQIAMEENLKNGDIAPRDLMSSYIRNGIDSLRCPAGGVYEYGTVGTDPKCSTHGTLTDSASATIAVK